MARKPGPILYCDRSHPTTGKPCTFSTKWGTFNLNRHVGREHKEEKDGFIAYLVDEQGVLQKGMPSTRAATAITPRNVTLDFTLTPRGANSRSENDLPPLTASLAPDLDFASVSRAIGKSSKLPLSTNLEFLHPASIAVPRELTTIPVASSTNTNDLNNHNVTPARILLSASLPRARPEPLLQDAGTIYFDEPLSLSADNVTPLNTVQRTPAQQLRDRTRKRLYDSLEQDSLPSYSVKRSKAKGLIQQRALDWTTYTGKMDFDRRYASLLAQWGLKESHKGTCLWLPAEWDAFEPLKLMEMFFAEDFPVSYAADGVAYSYKDHTTSLTRATAWFAPEHWPRNGAELDNFLGAGPYKLKQSSHLCHHHLCLIHLILEDPDINDDRKRCHEKAKFLRQEELPAPQFCAEHKPPCWMQHAALTTLETILIQFHVLLVAKGVVAPLALPRRPRWHSYSTFEYQLPLTFCPGDSAVILELENITNEAAPKGPTGRPLLKCPFCTGVKIKGCKSIIALWSHFLHQHSKPFIFNSWTQILIPEQDLLKEVVRTADLWLSYWRQYSDGGKKRDPTYLKCVQARQDDFTWKTVLEWNLT